MRIKNIVIVCFFVSKCLCSVLADTNPFRIPEGMEMRVQFWVDVFTKYSIHQHVIHDADQPERIYRVVDATDLLPYSDATREEKAVYIESEMSKVISILKNLASVEVTADSLSGEEERLYRLFGDQPLRQAFSRAARNVRVQGGMKEKFLKGIVRSGRYWDEIQGILREAGLPEEIAFLPHVESSFNPHAHSKYGAAGIWQFTRTTGCLYRLTIHNEIDERRDPIRSTEAATELLKYNYQMLKSWPLAITAYNHGLGGIQRAVRRVGSKNLNTIIRKYRHRRFGFASKNFYAEFLAAIWVTRNALLYYGEFEIEPSWKYRTVTLPIDYPAEYILTAYNLSSEEFRRLNPALRPPVLRGDTMIPRGYEIRLPVSDEWPVQIVSRNPGETIANREEAQGIVPTNGL